MATSFGRMRFLVVVATVTAAACHAPNSHPQRAIVATGGLRLHQNPGSNETMPPPSATATHASTTARLIKSRVGAINDKLQEDWQDWQAEREAKQRTRLEEREARRAEREERRESKRNARQERRESKRAAREGGGGAGVGGTKASSREVGTGTRGHRRTPSTR